MNDLRDPDTARRLTRLKRLSEDTQRLEREYQEASIDWDAVVAAFETLEEAISQKWEEGE